MGFRKKSSVRDLVTNCAARWDLHICRGNKIDMYLSDISGAFDKISRTFLRGKLSRLGLSDSYLNFLNFFLLSREEFVSVEGAKSIVMQLSNMMFQGTVLESMMWNSFFDDVATEVPQGNQVMNLSADDLIAETYHAFWSASHTVMDELLEIQGRTHVWGVQNQVTFDADKEFLKISILLLGKARISRCSEPSLIASCPCNLVSRMCSAKLDPRFVFCSD